MAANLFVYNDTSTPTGYTFKEYMSPLEDKINSIEEKYSYKLTVLQMKYDDLKSHFTEVTKSYYKSLNDNKHLLSSLLSVIEEYQEEERKLNIFKRFWLYIQGKGSSSRLASKMQNWLLENKNNIM